MKNFWHLKPWLLFPWFNSLSEFRQNFQWDYFVGTRTGTKKFCLCWGVCHALAMFASEQCSILASLDYICCWNTGKIVQELLLYCPSCSEFFRTESEPFQAVFLALLYRFFSLTRSCFLSQHFTRPWILVSVVGIPNPDLLNTLKPQLLTILLTLFTHRRKKFCWHYLLTLDSAIGEPKPSPEQPIAFCLFSFGLFYWNYLLTGGRILASPAGVPKPEVLSAWCANLTCVTQSLYGANPTSAHAWK